MRARVVLLRVVGVTCLLANVGIGVRFASTESSMGAKAMVMALLAVLVVVGLLCIAASSHLARRSVVTAEPPRTGGVATDGSDGGSGGV